MSKLERCCPEVRAKLYRSCHEVRANLCRSCHKVRAKLCRSSSEVFFCEVRFEVETISVPTIPTAKNEPVPEITFQYSAAVRSDS